MVRPSGAETGRFWPASELMPFIEHYWWVRWSVPEPQVAEVLSYPSVHVVFEGDSARIVGVVRGKFSRTLEGNGEVFAIKFHPGMFRAWYARPIVTLTDRSVPLGNELGTPARRLTREVLTPPTELERAKAIDARLREQLPEADAEALLARELVELVRKDSTLLSVAALSSRSGLGPRALQRLFRDYVGVGPKWVLSRFRLQEAAELLEKSSETVGAVAASLGYFDQAHFVRDFKAVVGRTPVEYVRRARAART